MAALQRIREKFAKKKKMYCRKEPPLYQALVGPLINRAFLGVEHSMNGVCVIFPVVSGHPLRWDREAYTLADQAVPCS